MVHLAPGVDPTLHTIVSELTRVSHPELILLFGSRATGNPREDSDYDLLVVLPDDADVDAARGACNAALWDARVSADVLARTASQYARWQHDPGFLDWLVAREGHVLYASGRVEQRSAARVRETEEGYDSWVARAMSDIKIAARALDGDDPVPDASCFHAHGCVEKLLKASIVRLGTFPPKTRDLSDLLLLVDARLRQDDQLRAACTLLQGLYPQSRYPNRPMPTVDDARTALEAANVARSRLP